MIWQACEQNSPTECLEISTIPSSVRDGDLESKVLNILEEIDIPVDPSLVKAAIAYPLKTPLRKSK